MVLCFSAFRRNAQQTQRGLKKLERGDNFSGIGAAPQQAAFRPLGPESPACQTYGRYWLNDEFERVANAYDIKIHLTVPLCKKKHISCE